MVEKEVLQESEISQVQEVQEPVIVQSPVQETAQTNVAQSVPQQTSASKDKRKLIILIIVLVIIVAAALLASTFLLNPPQKYVFTIDGISYQSNSYAPSEFFNEFKQNTVVYISPKITGGSSQFLTNEMQLWTTVLTAKGIKTILLIRVEAPGEIAFCQTNDGNVMKSEQISFEQCNALLNNSGNAVVAIEKNASENKVLLSKNRIDVFSTGNDSLGSYVNFSVIKQMFPDAQEILDAVNIRISGVNASSGVPTNSGASTNGDASVDDSASDTNVPIN